MEQAKTALGQFIRCTEVLGQEEEARRGGAENRQRSYKGQLREDDQAEEETRGHLSQEGWQEDPPGMEAREYADGNSRGVDPAVLSEGDDQSAPHREVQEEEDPLGKK